MHIVCIGGGPGGLYFSVLAKRANPAHHFLVEQDRLIYPHLTRHAVRWDSLAVIQGGKTDHIGGVGFSAVERKQLLLDLQRHARELGVELLFQHEVPDPRAHLDADLVIGSDGVNSAFAGRSSNASARASTWGRLPSRSSWRPTRKRISGRAWKPSARRTRLRTASASSQSRMSFGRRSSAWRSAGASSMERASSGITRPTS
jgi:anthraniloyl-CoA monooxygenase